MPIHRIDTDKEDANGRYHVNLGTEKRKHRAKQGRFYDWKKGRSEIRYKNLRPGVQTRARSKNGQRTLENWTHPCDVMICSLPYP